MGFTPSQVNEMSLWEFSVASRGWMIANGIKSKLQPPTDQEFESAVARLH